MVQQMDPVGVAARDLRSACASSSPPTTPARRWHQDRGGGPPLRGAGQAGPARGPASSSTPEQVEAALRIIRNLDPEARPALPTTPSTRPSCPTWWWKDGEGTGFC